MCVFFSFLLFFFPSWSLSFLLCKMGKLILASISPRFSWQGSLYFDDTGVSGNSGSPHILPLEYSENLADAVASACRQDHFSGGRAWTLSIGRVSETFVFNRIHHLPSLTFAQSWWVRGQHPVMLRHVNDNNRGTWKKALQVGREDALHAVGEWRRPAGNLWGQTAWRG